MQNFYNWLRQNNYAESTAKEDLASLERFTQWAKAAGYTEIQHLRYNDILVYVQHEKNRSLEIRGINQRLNSLSKYYQYLTEEGITTHNPAKRIRIKGTIKKVIQQPLSYTELENLYNQYIQYAEQKQEREKRDKQARERNIVLLSLLIWQGLNTGEIERLRTEHLHLSKGIINIPETSRSNSRELKLDPRQILPLNTYVKEIRSQMKPKGEELFTGGINDLFHRLMEELRGLNPGIRNAAHLRASVILYWLKLYDKRQVQYMLGYKHISSVEKYEQQDMETLTDQLKRHHPFG